jgi:hypothetical protein
MFKYIKNNSKNDIELKSKSKCGKKIQFFSKFEEYFWNTYCEKYFFLIFHVLMKFCKNGGYNYSNTYLHD